MADRNNEKLLKRIAKLVKQNQALERQLRDMTKKYEEMSMRNEENERLLAKYGDLREAKQRSDNWNHYRFEMVTVLFANIHGFTKLSDQKNAEAIMDDLDQIFRQFNAITKKYNIQKIKTIGDAYMAAGGLPVKNITNPIEIIMAALEMRCFLKNPNNHELNENNGSWDLGFGIHTGPVNAYITGNKKKNYELKGDTVNTATRVESVTEAGKIIISVMTYELVKEFFDCEYYGRIPVKYTGDLEMYEVKGLKPEFQADGNDIQPNEYFYTKYLLIQFTDVQEFMLSKLEEELPNQLYYHSVKHTVDVVTQVELIGWGEEMSEEDILLLKTAALFHDAGHIVNYDDHEYYSAELAKKYLPQYNYSQKQIDIISELIFATQLPPNPRNKLEEIMCDADLDYLGRSDFIPVSNTLYEELKEQNKVNSLKEWNKMQLKFISNHQYFTKTAKSLREVNKQKQIEHLKKVIEEDKKDTQEKGTSTEA